nr:ATP-binding protein [Pseudomonadota bacterium]
TPALREALAATDGVAFADNSSLAAAFAGGGIKAGLLLPLRREAGGFAVLALLAATAGGLGERDCRFLRLVAALLNAALAGRHPQRRQPAGDLAELAHTERLISLGEMTASLAHELRQPLTAVLNYSHGLLRRLDAQPAAADQELRGGVERIVRQARRANDIIVHLRGFAQRREIQRERFPINEVVEEMVQLCAPQASHSHAAVTVEAGSGLPPVAGDRLLIGQVILNLLRNALEASVAGGRPPPHPIVVRTGRSADGQVLVQIEDRGQGLIDAGCVFDLFFTTKPGGLGLGLAISRSIVEAHGGHLWADANPPGGAVFNFTLPTTEPGEHR